jgi:hypothetical protein
LKFLAATRRDVNKESNNHILGREWGLVLRDHALAQFVQHWLVAVETQVQALRSPYGIYGASVLPWKSQFFKYYMPICLCA